MYFILIYPPPPTPEKINLTLADAGEVSTCKPRCLLSRNQHSLYKGYWGGGVTESVWSYIIPLTDIIGFYKVIKNSIDQNLQTKKRADILLPVSISFIKLHVLGVRTSDLKTLGQAFSIYMKRQTTINLRCPFPNATSPAFLRQAIQKKSEKLMRLFPFHGSQRILHVSLFLCVCM